MQELDINSPDYFVLLAQPTITGIELTCVSGGHSKGEGRETDEEREKETEEEEEAEEGMRREKETN